MASYRPNIPTDVDAVLKLACVILDQKDRDQLAELLTEFRSGQLASGGNAVTDLATSAGVLVAVTAFATALNTNSWHVD